eukprot:EG_transcript_8025
MGMGKTIQAIALICANRPAPQRGVGDFSQGRPPCRATLIVTPTSAMMQWKEEITRHTEPGAVSVFVFHEKRTGVTAQQLAEHDVVLTTYPVVEAEWRKIINRHKVPCQYCGRKFLRRRLVVHQKFFCGPDAVRSLRLQKTEKKRKRAMAKGMRTLRITKGSGNSDEEDGEEDDDEDDEEDAEEEKESSARTSRRASIPTPSTLYRELMQSAGRKAHSMFTPKTSLDPEDAAQDQQQQQPSRKQQKSRGSESRAAVKAEARPPKQECIDVEVVQPDTAASSSRATDGAWFAGLDQELQLCIKGKALETLTVPTLRDVCRGLGLPAAAKRKEELVQRILEHTGGPAAPAAVKAEECVTGRRPSTSAPPLANTAESDSDVVIVRRTRSSNPPAMKKAKPEPPSSPIPQ